MKTLFPTLLITAWLAGCASGPGDIQIIQTYDSPPKALATPAPKYPYEALDEGVSGRSTIDFVVTRHGRVTEVAFVEPLPKILKESVLEATRSWRFEPAIKAGVAVDSRLRTTVEFRRNTESTATGTLSPR